MISSSENKPEGNVAFGLQDTQTHHGPVKKCILVIEHKSEYESIRESITCKTIKRKTRGKSKAGTLKGDNTEAGTERKISDIRVQPQCLECVFTFLPGELIP
ncbi:hypothetical protein XENTR_v10015786 [Xenopus tropicalis]|nr:hypothetical protein XENTR_v10015786 [Xenopus tropicalis]